MDLSERFRRIKLTLSNELSEVEAELALLKQRQKQKLPNPNFVISKNKEVVELRHGKIKITEGCFYVEKGAVSTMLCGSKMANSFAVSTNTLFVPKDFQIFCISDCRLVGVTPGTSAYENFIFDQLCFTHEMLLGDVTDRVLYVLRRLARSSGSNMVRVFNTDIAKVVNASREMIGRVLVRLQQQEKISRVDESKWYVIS